MADLRQLDEAALSDGEEQDRSPEDSDSIDQQQQQEQQEAQDWDDSGRQEIHVQQQQEQATTATSSALSEDEDGEASDAGLDDGVTTASKSSLQVAANIEELPYARLYHSWIQECRCPELVPLDHDTIATMRSVVADAEDPHDSDNDDEQQQQQQQHDNQHHHVKALLQSVRHVEAQRVKFLLADLVQRRLHKIQAHPQHTMKNLTDRMSDAEVCWLLVLRVAC